MTVDVYWLEVEPAVAVFSVEAVGGSLGGGYSETKPVRKKQTVVHKDKTDEREEEFKELLAKVKGQADTKAKAAATDAAKTAAKAPAPGDIKAPRMPEIKGVDSQKLKQWMPDLLSAYKAEYRDTYADQLRSALAAKAARRASDEEDIAILAALL